MHGQILVLLSPQKLLSGTMYLPEGLQRAQQLSR